MKILQVNQYNYPRGGADKYFIDLSRSLEANGHQVAIFSMHHPKNLPSPWSAYFVSRISFNEQTWQDKLKTPGRVLYSLEAKNKFSKLLADFRPDIIHIHNIYHHLSPSILDAAAQAKIPVVMHLHDYKLVCPNHSLFVNGAYCERCRPHKYYECCRQRCVKGSIPGSSLAMLEMYLHHCVMKVYERRVSLFIAPSRFMKETVVRFGQDGKKVEVIYNPFDRLPSLNVNDREQDYFLYFGRLSEEKGVDILIKASSLINQKIIIAGEGPEENKLKDLARKIKAPADFVGFRSGSDLQGLIDGAKAIIIPSIWAENMPLGLLEALDSGKIVIASKIGGLAEMIEDGQNGLLFKPGAVDDLAQRMKELDGLNKIELEKKARDSVANLSLEHNTKQIIQAYQSLLK